MFLVNLIWSGIIVKFQLTTKNSLVTDYEKICVRTKCKSEKVKNVLVNNYQIISLKIYNNYGPVHQKSTKQNFFAMISDKFFRCLKQDQLYGPTHLSHSVIEDRLR